MHSSMAETGRSSEVSDAKLAEVLTDIAEYREPRLMEAKVFELKPHLYSHYDPYNRHMVS